MIRWPTLLFSSLLLATLVLLEGGASLAQAYGARQTDASDWYMIALAIGAVVGIIMLFAQVKLFSIASSLKEILKELRPGTEQRNDINSIDSSLKEILKELRKRDGAQPKE